MNGDHFLVLVFIGSGMVLSVYKNKLTVPASLEGGLIGYLLFVGTGYAGIFMMAAFFVCGVLATGWKHQHKVQAGLAEANKGRRKASQVLANAGVPALSALFGLLLPEWNSLSLLMVAAAFASATSDTLSSEIGNIYGKRFYNIISLKKDQKGENGVVSREGFLAGLAGAALIAIIYSALIGWTDFFWIIILAGMAGNLFDSWIGARFERKNLIGNDMVNFCNTLFAASVAAVVTLSL